MSHIYSGSKRNATRRFGDGSGMAWEVGIDVERSEITLRTVGQRHVSRISIADEILGHEQILIPVPSVVPPQGPPVPVFHCTMTGERAPGPAPEPIPDQEPSGPGPAPGEEASIMAGMVKWAWRMRQALAARKNGGTP